MKIKTTWSIRLFSVLAVVFVNGCSSGLGIVKGEYDFTGLKDKAIVIVSATYNEDVCDLDLFNISMRKIPDGAAAFRAIIVRNTFIDPDFTHPYGTVQVFEVDPGVYEVTQLSIIKQFFSLTEGKVREFEPVISYKFYAKPGEIVYAGEMHYQFDKTCWRSRVKINNQWERDWKAVVSKVPNINPQKVKLRLMQQ